MHIFRSVVKNVLLLVFITVLVFGAFFEVKTEKSHAESPVVVFLDGKMLEFDVPPVIEKGRTLVPLRAIFEALGADVQWDQDTQTATAIKDNILVQLTVGEKKAYVNGREVKMDVPSKVVNQRTLVPLRFVSESLDATVGWLPKAKVITISTAPMTEYRVASTIDGDTLKVEKASVSSVDDFFDVLTGSSYKNLRLIGVDTPESKHATRPELNSEAGVFAAEYTEQQLSEKVIKVALDVEPYDRYNRLLGYVFLKDGTFYNAKLVEEGYARLATFPPNVQWVDLFTYLQKDAREHKRGFWADGEYFTTLEDETKPSTDSTNTTDPTQSTASCDQPLIKGNKNSMIYHLPGGRYYDSVAEKNAIYFCTEEEAQAAGYRRSKQ